MANPCFIDENKRVYYKYEKIINVIKTLKNLTDTWEFNPFNGHVVVCECEECDFIDDSEYGWIAIKACNRTLCNFLDE